MSISRGVSRTARVQYRSYCTGESEGSISRQLRDGGPLIPAAPTPTQRALEAELLLSLLLTAEFVSIRSTERHLSTMLRRVVLGSPLSLDISADLAPHFIHQSLPFVADGLNDGIPGLRPIPGRDHLDLRTIDGGGTTRASARLLGVGRQALQFPRQSDPVWSSHRARLHPAELASIRNARRQPDDLLSGILRRLMLWRSATFMDVQLQPDGLEISWQDGPPSAAVAAVLTESACGLGAVTAQHAATGSPTLLITRSDYQLRSRSEPHSAWLEILRSFDHIPTPVLGPVTLDVWEQRAMRDALSDRDVSQIYRLLRRRGVSQRQIAALTGQSQSEVSEILKGRQVMAYDVLARIADGLSIPRGYMGLAYDEATAVRVATSEVDPQVEENESVKRRRFLAHAAAVVAGVTSRTDSTAWTARHTEASPLAKSLTGLWFPDTHIRLALPNGQCSHCGFRADLDVYRFRGSPDGDLGAILMAQEGCPRCSGSAGFQTGQDSWIPEGYRPTANARSGGLVVPHTNGVPNLLATPDHRRLATNPADQA